MNIKNIKIILLVVFFTSIFEIGIYGQVEFSMDLLPLKKLKKPDYFQLNYNKFMLGFLYNYEIEDRFGIFYKFTPWGDTASFKGYQKTFESTLIKKNYELYLGCRFDLVKKEKSKFSITPNIFIKSYTELFIDQLIDIPNIIQYTNDFIKDPDYLRYLPLEDYQAIRDTVTEIKLGLGCDFTYKYNISDQFFVAVDAQLQFMRTNLRNVRTRYHPDRVDFETHGIYGDYEYHILNENYFDLRFTTIGRIRFGYIL